MKERKLVEIIMILAIVPPKVIQTKPNIPPGFAIHLFSLLNILMNITRTLRYYLIRFAKNELIIRFKVKTPSPGRCVQNSISPIVNSSIFRPRENGQNFTV